MTIEINNYDGTFKASIEDGTVNDGSASIKFVGKGWKPWGKPTQDNLLWMLQNFAGETEPVYPVKGQLWYDTGTDANIVKVYDGNSWVSSNGVIYQTNEPATGTSPGSFWYDTTNEQLKVWSGDQWDIVGPLGSAANTDPINPAIIPNSAIEAIRIRDAADNNLLHQLWRITVGGTIVAIISKDQAFVPESGILTGAGFNTIYPGINFPNAIGNVGVNGAQITQSIVPNIDNAVNLGSEVKRFANVYSNVITSTGNVKVFGTAYFGASSASKATTVWASSTTMATPPKLGAIEFDGTSFYFTNLQGGVPTRQSPLFAQSLVEGKRLYVSRYNGSDLANGSAPDKAKRTIRAALDIAEDGDTIFVESGEYIEQNPLYVPPRVSIIGDNLRRTIVRPAHPQLDIIHCSVGTYFYGMTFKGHRSPAFCFSFPCSTAIATISGGAVTAITPMYSQTSYVTPPVVTVEPPAFGGVVATASANLVNGAIVDVKLTNGGSGYSTTPGAVTVSITDPGGEGIDALLIAEVDLTGTVTSVNVARPGEGYSGNVTISIDDAPGGTGTGATATVTLGDGVIGSYNILTGGSGYIRTPHVSVQAKTPQVITSSPYVQNCSSITGPYDINGREIPFSQPLPWPSPTDPGSPYAVLDPNGAGGGLRIDGDLLSSQTVIRSFVADSFTQINQGGIGHLIINRGYAQFVSCFTTFSSVGYWARSGGFANISNSVIDFGDIGLKAEGYYPTAYETGTLSTTYTSKVGGVVLSSSGSGYTPSSTFNVTFTGGGGSGAQGTAVVSSDGTVDRVTITNQGSGYTDYPTINWTAGAGPGVVAPVGTVEMVQNSNVIVTSSNVPPIEPKNSSAMKIGNNFYTVISANSYSSTQWNVDIYPPLLAGASGAAVAFHDISNLSTGGLALEYVGSGVTYNALPVYGGVPNVSKQVVDQDSSATLKPGRVYYVTIDNTGNFKIGKYFSVNFADGSVTINTKNFNLSGLSGIGPFRRNGVLVGTNCDEISNDAVLTHSANPTYDTTTVPTQYAVRQYLQQMTTSLLPDSDGILSLGSATKRWNKVYGNVEATTGNITTVNATTVKASISNATIVNGTVVNAGTINTTSLGTVSFGTSTGSTTGDFLIGGNLTVTGSSFVVESTVYQVIDPVIEIGTAGEGVPLPSDDGNNRGVMMHVYNPVGATPAGESQGFNHAFMGRSDAPGALKGHFVYITNVAAGSTTVVTNPVPIPGSVGSTTHWGNVAVGTTQIFGDLTASGVASFGQTTVNGELRVTGDIVAFYVPSDANLKENLEKIPNALDKVAAINGYTFNWNQTAVDKRHKNAEVKDAGVIAQELEAILPEAVITREDGYKSVDYNKIAPLFIEAIKDLKAEIDQLKKKIQ